ncbi:CpaF family protein [uncultured Helcococcus sp.]|uniref:CpaF family protein n=1 Tax=uncultured Helcococcus sp. TaxID=1072508 RepID=UPI002631B390|nr:CpaF family protein [uncultured Helcococcus sp.]
MLDIDQLRKQIDNSDILKLNDEELIIYLNNYILSYASKNKIELEIDQVNKYSKELFYDLRGLGILEYFLEDDLINEIMINSYNQIYIEKEGNIFKSHISFRSEKELDRIIQKIVSDSGREVNISNPIVDANLYDGSRVNIVLPPISNHNPIITIRKFSKHKLSIKDLINSGSLTEELAVFLEKLVKAKYNIIIGGGTSSGKTTFLNALSNFIDDNERIITIEDSRELQIQNKKNLISLQTRNSNSSNKGKVTIKDLIRNSLRMRPDRIIVGEVRSDETVDMLQAMSTGHDGSLSTAHANSAKDMISRLETMVLRSGEKIPIEAVRRMINSSIEILIHLDRVDSKRRRVIEVAEMLRDDSGDLMIKSLYKYNYKTDKIEFSDNLTNKDKLERWIANG